MTNDVLIFSTECMTDCDLQTWIEILARDDSAQPDRDAELSAAIAELTSRGIELAH